MACRSVRRDTFSGMRMDTASRKVEVNAPKVSMTDMEFDVLAMLVARLGDVGPWATLVVQIWGAETRDHE